MIIHTSTMSSVESASMLVEFIKLPVTYRVANHVAGKCVMGPSNLFLHVTVHIRIIKCTTNNF